VIPVVGARLEELDQHLLEASYDLGATKFQTFRYIVLPFLAPSLLASALLVFILSLDDFVLSFFCSGPATQTLPVYLFALIRAGASPMVNVISTLMLLVSAAVVALFAWVEFGRRE
jgi:spermidine/putrescine transport system permease protein